MIRKMGINTQVSKVKVSQNNIRDIEHKIIEKTLLISAIFLIISIKMASAIANIIANIKSGLQLNDLGAKIIKIFKRGKNKRIIKYIIRQT